MVIGGQQVPGTRLHLVASTFLITIYFAICALNYVSENVAIGWFIVIATAIVIAVTMIRSFQTRDVFGLGFAVFGSVWLSATLGFTLETPTSFKVYNPRPTIWRIMSLGRTPRKIEDYNNVRESTIHDLYHSMGMIRLPDYRGIPSYNNTFRLLACWSALIAGMIGGMFFSVVMKPNRRTTVRSDTACDDDLLN